MSGKIIEGPKLKFAVPSISIGQVFFESCEKYGDRICQVDGTLDKTETYNSVKVRSTRVAIELQRRGITSSDVIVFCTSNTLDAVIPILATFYIGAKVACLHHEQSQRQMQHLISLVLPKIMFVEELVLNMVEEIVDATGLTTEIIVYEDSEKYTSLSELTTPKDEEDAFRPAKVNLQDTILMLFTSGTSGMPKVVCQSHATFIHWGASLFAYEYREGIGALYYSTFYWNIPMFILLNMHMCGGYRVFCRSIEAENTFQLIEKYKIVYAFMAPILTYSLTSFDRAEDYDTSSLEFILCGGARISQSQFDKMDKLFKHTSICGIYGTSETGHISVFLPFADKHLIATKTGSCGKVCCDVKLKVVDLDTEEILGPNQKGEFRVKSPSCFKGYYKKESSQGFDEDGFVKTGDVGYYDEDCCLYILDRCKEMFKYGIWHVVPTALEQVILEHPDVQEAVVFGIPYGVKGQVPAACIVLKENKEKSNFTKEEISEFVAKRVSDAEKLRGGIVFVSGLPRTPTGKVIREESKNLFLKFC